MLEITIPGDYSTEKPKGQGLDKITMCDAFSVGCSVFRV